MLYFAQIQTSIDIYFGMFYNKVYEFWMFKFQFIAQLALQIRNYKLRITNECVVFRQQLESFPQEIPQFVIGNW